MSAKAGVGSGLGGERIMQEYQHEVINVNPDLAFKLRFFVNESLESPPHWHNCLEVLHVFRGTLRVVLNGKRFMMRDDDVMVVNPQDVHATHAMELLDAALIQIPHDALNAICPNTVPIHFDFNTAAMTAHRKQELHGFAQLLGDMYEVYRLKNRGYGFKVISQLCDFFHRLAVGHVSLHRQAEHKTEKYMERLETVTRYVLEHYNRPITIGEMASVAYLNQEYFSRFFKKYMGMTPIEYLSLIRVQHIAADLVTTDNKITDLAIMHGCGDYKLFLRHFRATFGCSPMEYRKKPYVNDFWTVHIQEQRGVHVS
jgi:AraC-like DNA-binding protein/mannose-6-phosphate isomerase-like protein (cupin superfamily)